MNISQIVKSTQEQAVASWVDHLNQLRLNELLANLTAQDANLENALNVLREFKFDIDMLINSNRGGEKGIRGFIAERAQVSIENARKLIEGLKTEYVLVDDNGAVDLLRNGVPIQQKFVQELLGLSKIKEHLEKYPDFIKNGGKYQIPKDFFASFQKYATMSPEQGNRLAGAERRLYVAVQEFIKKSGIDIKDIEPAVVNYNDVQKGRIDETIDKEEKSIKEKDQERRDDAHQQSKPSLQEGLKVTAISAGIEGGMSFCLSVSKKLKSGKKIAEFTAEDWKDVGIDTAVGGGKGAIRGASIYGLTNFTATPAAVASALVTATFGVVGQARLLHQGKISTEDFIINSEIVCLDVTISAISSLIGQVMIPVPVLGAVIGNAVGMFMYGIAKNNLSLKEQALITSFNNDMKRINEQLDARYLALIEQLIQEFTKFKSVLDLAFDIDVNVAFAGSIALAQYVGCTDDMILWNKQSIDNYFQN